MLYWAVFETPFSWHSEAISMPPLTLSSWTSSIHQCDWISLYETILHEHSSSGPKRNQDGTLQPLATEKQKHSANTDMSALRKSPGHHGNTTWCFQWFCARTVKALRDCHSTQACNLRCTWASLSHLVSQPHKVWVFLHQYAANCRFGLGSPSLHFPFNGLQIL